MTTPSVIDVVGPELGLDKPRRYKVRDRAGEVIGTGATLTQVSVEIVKVDSAYQRDLSMEAIRKYAAAWSANKAGVIILSSRLGGPWVIDGQHRLAAAREAGIPHLAAMVVDGLTKKDEARLFVDYNSERRGHTALGKFKAQLVAEDAEALGIVRVVHNAGYLVHVSSSRQPNHITAINSLVRIYRLGGGRLLAEVLGLVKGLWYGEVKATDGQLLYGLALFLESSRNKVQYDHERLERVMRERAPLRVLREAQAVAIERQAASVSASNIAEALIRFYDAGVTLQDKKLSTLVIGKKQRPAPRSR